MTYADLQAQAKNRHLAIMGGFHPEPGDGVPVACRTLLLLGPDEPAFWPAFTESPEWQDGRPDPMDRWSARVIGGWAAKIGAAPLYPFGPPPYLPFFTWALRTGRAHVSPLMLLVHDMAGLLVSFRGALALPERLALPPAPPNPCKACDEKPCRTACPVAAFDGSGYDVAACKGYLDTPPGQTCMTRGCAARNACPVSRRHARVPEHAAYHMKIFKG